MIHPLTIGQLKKFGVEHDNVEVVILPKVSANDKIDVEYCYSGFLGQRVTIFLWNGKKLLATISENKNKELVISPMENQRKLQRAENNTVLNFFLGIYRNIPRFFENL